MRKSRKEQANAVKKLHKRADQAIDLHQFEDALAHLDRALILLRNPVFTKAPVWRDATRAGSQMNRGSCLSNLGRLNDALEAFDAALALHQRDHLARQRWSQKFGPVVKVDRMTRETIRNDKEKDAYA